MVFEDILTWNGVNLKITGKLRKLFIYISISVPYNAVLLLK